MQRNSDHDVSSLNPKLWNHLGDHIKNFAKKYVDAIEQNALSRRVSGFSGGTDTERNRRRVDGSLTLLRLGASLTSGDSGSGDNLWGGGTAPLSRSCWSVVMGSVAIS